MDGYELLKKRAAEKLEQTISAARREYKERVDRINALRKELGDEPEVEKLKLHETALEMVRRWAPRDRNYT